MKPELIGHDNINAASYAKLEAENKELHACVVKLERALIDSSIHKQHLWSEHEIIKLIRRELQGAKL